MINSHTHQNTTPAQIAQACVNAGLSKTLTHSIVANHNKPVFQDSTVELAIERNKNSCLRDELAAANLQIEQLKYDLRILPRNPEAQRVINTICELFDVPRRVFLGEGRIRKITALRFIGYKVIRELDERLSFLEIARNFYKADHSTIMHGYQSANLRIKTDPEFKAKYDRLMEALG